MKSFQELTVFIIFRSQVNWSCFYSSAPLTFMGKDTLISTLLRVICSIKLLLHSNYYYNHPAINKYCSVIATVASNQAKDTFKKWENLIEEGSFFINFSKAVWSGFFFIAKNIDLGKQTYYFYYIILINSVKHLWYCKVVKRIGLNV